MVGKSRLSRSGAKACAWAGRGGVLAAGAATAMLLLGGTPAGDTIATDEPPVVTSKTETPTTQPDTPSKFGDFDLLGDQLIAWDGPAPDTASPDITNPVQPTASANGLAYLGIIKMGERQRALMFLDGRQRFMREGQSVGQFTLVSIAQDHVMLREGRAERRVDRQVASSDRLGYLGSSGAPVRLSTPNNFGESTIVGDPSEQRRQEIARRIEQRSRATPTLPNGVPAAKARNLPSVDTDGQEGS
jgi:hypothetical protein